nr:FAD-dependent monooxygenase [Sphingomonas quercus]
MIVGGGIAGLSAALALSKLGSEVHLVEVQPRLQAIGTGLTMSLLTCRALRDLGVGDEVAAQGFRHNGWDVHDRHGNHIESVLSAPSDSGELLEGAILRPVLHAILADRVRATDVRLELGASVSGLSSTATGCTVTFSNGRQGTYDMVVAADGAYSSMRRLIMPEFAATPYSGQVCWRALFDRPAHVVRGMMFQSDHAKMGLNPCSSDKMYMFFNEAVAEPQRHSRSHLANRLREILGEFEKALAGLIPAIDEHVEINYRPLDACLVRGAYHRGRVILIGDAAHGPTPHLGAGAGLAVEDALVLAREVDASAGCVSRAFASFMKIRSPRVEYVVETSLKLGRMEMAGEPVSQRTEIMAQARERMKESYS